MNVTQPPSPLSPTSPALTRRMWISTVVLGAVCWTGRSSAFGQETSRAEPGVGAYDELMQRFMREHKPPGAALAVTYHGRLVYARSFGHADLEKREPVEPDSLFRIASISKPFTAATVLHLIEKGKVHLDDRVFPLLKLHAHLERGAKIDPRLHDIRVHHCLQHTAGWDREKSWDPMSAQAAEEVAQMLKIRLPIHARQIIQVAMGKPLDFDPGTRYAYSNFGYCVLGRVIEEVSGKPYHEYVSQQILTPLGIRRMRLGKNLLRDRAPGEVKYYDAKKRTGRAISEARIGEQLPLPYGVECIETMDANGGWIASAVDLVRFASAFDDAAKCPVIRGRSITDHCTADRRTIRSRQLGIRRSGPEPIYHSPGKRVETSCPPIRQRWLFDPHTGMALF